MLYFLCEAWFLLVAAAPAITTIGIYTGWIWNVPTVPTFILAWIVRFKNLALPRPCRVWKRVPPVDCSNWLEKIVSGKTPRCVYSGALSKIFPLSNSIGGAEKLNGYMDRKRPSCLFIPLPLNRVSGTNPCCHLMKAIQCLSAKDLLDEGIAVPRRLGPLKSPYTICKKLTKKTTNKGWAIGPIC